MGLLRQVVDNHKEGVKAMGRREICDEVHRNGLPIPSRDFKRIKVAIGSMPSSFVSLTEVT